MVRLVLVGFFNGFDMFSFDEPQVCEIRVIEHDLVCPDTTSTICTVNDDAYSKGTFETFEKREVVSSGRRTVLLPFKANGRTWNVRDFGSRELHDLQPASKTMRNHLN